MILWLGWFGFNGGSQLAVNTAKDAIAIAQVFLNTNAAAAGGVIGALLVGKMLSGKADVTMAMNGALAGLVVITAGPDTPSGGSGDHYRFDWRNPRLLLCDFLRQDPQDRRSRGSNFGARRGGHLGDSRGTSFIRHFLGKSGDWSRKHFHLELPNKLHRHLHHQGSHIAETQS